MSTSTAIIMTILSSGSLTALVQMWGARKKAPMERDSLIASSSSDALLTMKAALESETARADRAEEREREKDKKIDHLQSRLMELQGMLDQVRAEVDQLRSARQEESR